MIYRVYKKRNLGIFREIYVVLKPKRFAGPEKYYLELITQLQLGIINLSMS